MYGGMLAACYRMLRFRRGNRMHDSQEVQRPISSLSKPNQLFLEAPHVPIVPLATSASAPLNGASLI